MKERSFREPESRLVDSKFLSELQNAVADRLDDLATNPALNNAGFPLDIGEKIRKGEKVTASIMVRDAITGVGQDFRLTPDEIDTLKNKFLI